VKKENRRVIPRKVVKVTDEVLQKEIEEKYVQRAIDLGATGAQIVPVDMVSIDDRAVAKCVYPKCPFYGTSANCPPYALDIEKVRKVISRFRYGLFIWLRVPPEDTVGKEGHSKVARWVRKMNEIVTRIEAEAYYDGYMLAIAFAGGPCKKIFCPDSACTALVPGEGCRHPLRARSAMEAVGIDAVGLATKVGLDVYPLGESVSPSDVPHGWRFGIVFVD